MREIMEELSITINVNEKITEEIFKDENIDIVIHYFFCSLKEGKIKLTEHEGFLWIEKIFLDKYNLVPSDKKILSLI